MYTTFNLYAIHTYRQYRVRHVVECLNFPTGLTEFQHLKQVHVFSEDTPFSSLWGDNIGHPPTAEARTYEQVLQKQNCFPVAERIFVINIGVTAMPGRG